MTRAVETDIFGTPPLETLIWTILVAAYIGADKAVRVTLDLADDVARLTQVTVPVEVMVRGLSVAGSRVTGPGTLLLIVFGIYLTLFDPKISLEVHGFEPQVRQSPPQDTHRRACTTSLLRFRAHPRPRRSSRR